MLQSVTEKRLLISAQASIYYLQEENDHVYIIKINFSSAY